MKLSLTTYGSGIRLSVILLYQNTVMQNKKL